MSVSRRRVLAAIATAGGAGALSGVGTSALLHDQARGRGALTSGGLDVEIAYWLEPDGSVDADDPDGVVNGPRVDVPVGVLDEGRREGSVLLRFSLPTLDSGRNNPARLWIRTGCPPGTTLAEFLELSLSYADADGTPREPILTDRSVREVATAFQSGYALDGNGDPTDGDQDCLTDDLFVLVEYDMGSYVGTETVSLPLFVAATQCRNDDRTTPFPDSEIDGPCEPEYACDCCWAIGKVEVETPLQQNTTYQFDEGLAGYGIHVTETDGDSGVAFELVAADGRPVLPLCDVRVKGGPDDEQFVRHTDEYGFETTVLEEATDGLIYAPENPNNGGRYGISYVLVAVCMPLGPDGCPDNVVSGAASVGSSGRGKPSEKDGRGA